MLCKARILEDGIDERNACLLDREMQETTSILEGNLDTEIVRNFVIYNVKYSTHASHHPRLFHYAANNEVWGSKKKVQSFLTSALNGGEWSASLSGRLNLRHRIQFTPRT
jgi:hypothetical protein